MNKSIKHFLFYSVFNVLICTAGGAYYSGRPGSASFMLFTWAIINLILSIFFYFLWQRAEAKTVK